MPLALLLGGPSKILNRVPPDITLRHWLKRYVVMNNIDTKSFLNEYTMEYLSKEGNENDRKLDQSTVSSLIENMDTEHDRGVVRAIMPCCTHDMKS